MTNPQIGQIRFFYEIFRMNDGRKFGIVFFHIPLSATDVRLHEFIRAKRNDKTEPGKTTPLTDGLTD